MKKLNLLLASVLLCILPSGCNIDGTEVDNQVYTLVMGCDLAAENKIRITIQFPTYKSGGGGGASGMEKKGGGGGEGGNKNIVDGSIVETIEAPSILEALDLFSTSTTRRVSFVHIKAIIFSEDMARQGIRNFLEPIARFRETRRIMQVIVCKGSAEDFIRENKTNIGDNISKAMELSAMQANHTGLFPDASFQSYYTAIVSPYSQPYAIYAGLNDMNNLKPIRQDDNPASPFRPLTDIYPGEVPRQSDRKIEFLGTALFNGDKMVGTLSSAETRFFLMVTGEYQRGIITIEDRNSPGKAIPLDLRLGRKPVIKASFVNGKPVINIRLNVEADLGAIQSRIQYERLDKLGDLNNQIKAMVYDGVTRTVKKVQQNWNTDIFGFGRAVARNFFTVTEFEKYNWLSHFKDAQINVDVTANVRRTGLMYHSAPIRYNDNTELSEGDMK